MGFIHTLSERWTGFSRNLALRQAGNPSRRPDPAAPVDLSTVLAQLESDILLTLRIITNASAKMQSQMELEHAPITQLNALTAENAQATFTGHAGALALQETVGLARTAARNMLRDSASATMHFEDVQDLVQAMDLHSDSLTTSANALAPVQDSIAAMARRCDMLALNSSLEAARHRHADSCLPALAAEGQRLAEHMHVAARSLSVQMAQIATTLQQHRQGINKLATLAGQLAGNMAGLNADARIQSASCEALCQSADRQKATADTLQDKAAALKSAAASVLGEATRTQRCALAATQLLDRLTQRSVVFLRNSSHGNRRLQERVPARVPGVLACGSLHFYVLTVEISRGGCVLAAADGTVALPLLTGTMAHLQLEGLGTIAISVLASSELGFHVRFENLTRPAGWQIAGLIRRIHQEHLPTIELTHLVAANVAHAFSHALASGTVALHDLMSTDYQPLPDSDPVQYATPGLVFYEHVLPPILESARLSPLNPLFVVATDRNAYAPVHHPEYSKPQRSGEPVWNDLNARNKRLHDRWLTLIGARNRASYSLHAYVRHARNGAPQAIEVIAAPVQVRGILWGNIQIGREY